MLEPTNYRNRPLRGLEHDGALFRIASLPPSHVKSTLDRDKILPNTPAEVASNFRSFGNGPCSSGADPHIDASTHSRGARCMNNPVMTIETSSALERTTHIVYAQLDALPW